MQQHLRDYVWMALPGGAAERVPTRMDEISRKMAAGYGQVFPASDDTVTEYPAESRAAEEAQ
jgi:hypothetical protein